MEFSVMRWLLKDLGKLIKDKSMDGNYLGWVNVLHIQGGGYFWTVVAKLKADVFTYCLWATWGKGC